MGRALITLLFLFLASSASVLLAEVIVLKDGTRIEGKILEENEKGVKIKTPWGEAFIERTRIKEVIKKVKKIENPCPCCSGSGKMKCDRCKGTKLMRGACPACEGKGGTPCKRCKATGKRKCSTCRGRGKRRTLIAGRGWKDVTCSRCRGHGYLLCSRCKGSGLKPCPTCKGETTGPCDRCFATGCLRCIVCKGTGERKDPRKFLQMSYADLMKAFSNPEKTELQHMQYWNGIRGQWILWPALVTDAGKNPYGYYLILNLDRSKTGRTRGPDGKPIPMLLPHAYAYVREAEIPKLAALSKGTPIWVIGELTGPHYRSVMMRNTEVYPEAHPQAITPEKKDDGDKKKDKGK